MRMKESAYLTAIVTSSPDAMICQDLSGLITSWNPSAERLFQYSADEAIGEPARMLLPEDRPEESREILERVLGGKGVDRHETVRRRKDGSLVDMALTVYPVRDEDGRILGISEIGHDLTALKKAAHDLEESKATFAAILACAMDAIVSVDEQRKILFFNQAAERMFRCSAADAQRTTLDRFLPSLFDAAHRPFAMSVGRSDSENGIKGRPRTIMGLRADGEEFPIEASISHLQANGQSLYMVIIRDITERQQAEEALREGREHLRAIVETAVDGIITISEHGMIETVNHAVERIFHYSEGELVGQNVNILMPDPDHRQHDEYLQRYRDTGERRIIGVGREVIGRRKDGSLFPIELSISDTRLPGRRFFTAILRDITERKQAEADLRLMTRELDQRVAIRTEELVRSQARLRSLATELSLAEQRVRRQVATELHDYLGQLLVVARHKLTQTMRGVEDPGLANQLKEADNALESAISYSRSLVGELTPPVLREFGFTMALTWLAQQMQRNHLRVDLQLSAPSMDLPDDEAVLIFLSIRELLMNVVKHAYTDRATVSVSLTPQGEWEIAVIDKGRGFDPDLTAVEHKGKLDYFGLFSIRERMAALGGRLEVLSAPQHGTRAVLVLPAAGRSPGSLDQPAEHSESGSRSTGELILRVLLVDDHVMVRQELKSILSAYNDIVVIGEAADGHEAVDQTQTHRPDVVIMDVNMPKLDGVEATKRIKRRFPSTTVVGLSVQGGAHIERVIRDAGASYFVTKDQAGERLYQAIHRAVHSA